jgi:hypothetical protein
MNAVRTMILGLVGISTLAMAAGCSAELPGNDDVRASISEAPVDPEGIILVGGVADDCTGITPATHAQATKLFRFALGDDSVTFPAGAACTNTKNALLQVRAGIANSSYSLVSQAFVRLSQNVCGVPSAVYQLNEPSTSSSLGPILTTLRANVDSCFGVGVRVYLSPSSSINTSGSFTWMDPEPATLTANLASTAGASAAAYYSDSLVSTTVRKWGTGYVSCSGVVGGTPCSNVALSSGQQATQVIGQSNTVCRCL